MFLMSIHLSVTAYYTFFAMLDRGLGPECSAHSNVDGDQIRSSKGQTRLGLGKEGCLSGHNISFYFPDLAPMRICL